MEGESGGLRRVEGDWSGPSRVGRHIKAEIDLGALLLLLHAERGGHWASRRKNLVLLRLNTQAFIKF
jgi:hypothetical protein